MESGFANPGISGHVVMSSSVLSVGFLAQDSEMVEAIAVVAIPAVSWAVATGMGIATSGAFGQGYKGILMYR